MKSGLKCSTVPCFLTLLTNSGRFAELSKITLNWKEIFKMLPNPVPLLLFLKLWLVIKYVVYELLSFMYCNGKYCCHLKYKGTCLDSLTSILSNILNTSHLLNCKCSLLACVCPAFCC